MTKQILFIAVAMIGTVAHAELGRKAPLKVDFHSMIVESQQERAGLAKGVETKLSRKSSKAKPTDQNRVTDFVDVEIGWGEAPQMVDRRFDSINEPVLVLPATAIDLTEE